MPEKDAIFSSDVKYGGIFSFKDFYIFCHEWITEEMDMDLEEKKYEEKIKGDEKEIKIEWRCEKKITDYFRFDMKVEMEIKGLTNVEVVHEGVKIKTNNGSVKIKVRGTLVRDYESKFEISAGRKFMRAIYEKWVIPARVEEMKDKIVTNCDKFLSQAKAYLDLEGKK